MILEYDGLDSRWEKDVNWDLLHPQEVNSDEGYDVDGAVAPQQIILLERVAQWERSTENEYEGNVTEVELDNNYHAKCEMLIKHFSCAFYKGEVSWRK